MLLVSCVPDWSILLLLEVLEQLGAYLEVKKCVAHSLGVAEEGMMAVQEGVIARTAREIVLCRVQQKFTSIIFKATFQNEPDHG